MRDSRLVGSSVGVDILSHEHSCRYSEHHGGRPAVNCSVANGIGDESECSPVQYAGESDDGHLTAFKAERYTTMLSSNSSWHTSDLTADHLQRSDGRCV